MAKVGVVQAGSVLGDTAGTLAKLERLCTAAANEGLKLAVFPEAFIGGYPKGLTFGAAVGMRTDAGRELFRQYAECAITVPGPFTAELGKLARKARLYLVVGVIERDGGTLYCTALYLGASGDLLGKHRKLIPTASERLIWGYGDGSTLSTFDTPFGRVGSLICWENYMPLARMSLYLQGVQIYCAPTVDDRDVWIPTMRHIAREGRCFVLSSCQFLERAGYPRPWLEATHDLAETPIRGGSCIIGPLGDFMAEPTYGSECILSADVNVGELARAKFDFDVVGHYARPDIFEFSVKAPS